MRAKWPVKGYEVRQEHRNGAGAPVPESFRPLLELVLPLLSNFLRDKQTT